MDEKTIDKIMDAISKWDDLAFEGADVLSCDDLDNLEIADQVAMVSGGFWDLKSEIEKLRKLVYKEKSKIKTS